MLRSAHTITLSLIGILISPLTLASEKIRAGAELFQEGRCITCHQSKPFNAQQTKLSSFKSLNTMVEACNTNLGLGWFPDEVEAVSHYLNHHHYRFPTPEGSQ